MRAARRIGGCRVLRNRQYRPSIHFALSGVTSGTIIMSIVNVEICAFCQKCGGFALKENTLSSANFVPTSVCTGTSAVADIGSGTVGTLNPMCTTNAMAGLYEPLRTTSISLGIVVKSTPIECSESNPTRGCVVAISGNELMRCSPNDPNPARSLPHMCIADSAPCVVVQPF